MIRSLLAAATLVGLLPVVLSQWSTNACTCGGDTIISMSNMKICSWGAVQVPFYPGNDCILTTLPFGSCTQPFNCNLKCLCQAQWFPPQIDSVPHLGSWKFLGPSRSYTNTRLVLESWAEEWCEAPSLTPLNDAGVRGPISCSEWNSWIDWPQGLPWPPRTMVNPGRGTNNEELPTFNASSLYETVMAENRRQVEEWDEAQMAFDALDSDDPSIDKVFVQEMIQVRNLTRPAR